MRRQLQWGSREHHIGCCIHRRRPLRPADAQRQPAAVDHRRAGRRKDCDVIGFGGRPEDSGPLPPVAVFDNYWAPTLAFAWSLGCQGVPLHFYGTGAGRWSRFCSYRNSCPPVDDAERLLPWLQQRIRSGEITRSAPTTDLIAYYTSLLRADFPPAVQ